MKEYIERGELLKELERFPHLERSAGCVIRSAPAADVVEVVRCKDCAEYNGNRYCQCLETPILEDDFCSYGERKGQK